MNFDLTCIAKDQLSKNLVCLEIGWKVLIDKHLNIE